MRARTGRSRNYIDHNLNVGELRHDGIYVKELGYGALFKITELNALESPLTASVTHTCTVALIPAGALVLGVSAKVDPTGVLATSATWSIGISGNTDLFGTTIARTAGTTVTSANREAENAAVTPGLYFAAQTALVLTSSSGNWSTGAGGSIRIVIVYATVTAPTSTSNSAG